MKQYISFDLTDYLKKIGVLGISYQTHTRRIYNSFNDDKTKTIIVDVYGDDIKKTVDDFKKQVKGTMNQNNQGEFIKCYSDNWYKVLDVMNGNGDADPNQMSTSTITPYPNPNLKPLSKPELIIVKAKDNIVRIFTDEYNAPHVAIKVNDHLEVLSLSSGKFRNWISRIMYKEENEIIDDNDFKKAVNVLSAEAIFDSGDPIELNLRIAQRKEPIIEGDTVNGNSRIVWYYDLTNKDHEFIEITSEGWNIIKNKELILFRRFSNQVAQVYPLKTGEYVLDDFMDLLLNKNIKDEYRDDYKLLSKCYIISLLIPEIQKPVLMPHGSQGSGKSTIFDKIKMIVDPSVITTLSFPRDNKEFQQQLSHNYVAFYDNISYLKYWQSDEICRAVSNSGSSVRKNYTDDEDFIRKFRRVVGINGINLAATKPDLLSRGLQFQLEGIEKTDRLKEQTVNKKFEELRPYVLGTILDILVKVLRFKETEQIEIKEYQRMADFSEYGEIISRCLGYEDNAFLDAYERNTKLQIDQVIESSQLATAIMYLMFTKYGKDKDDYRESWQGSATALLGELNSVATNQDLNIDVYGKYWVKDPTRLVIRLNEIKTTLKDAGLEIDYLKNQGEDHHKEINIRKLASTESIASTEKNQA